MYLRDRPPDVSTRLASSLRDIAGRFLADEDVPGASMAIVREGVRASAHAGVRDVPGGQAADDRTLYRIASISKTFTACAVLALRDATRLSLDDPVVDHLPEIAAVRDPFGPVDRITVRMVLQHTSGLQAESPGDAPQPWRPRPIEDLLDRLDRTAVTTPPGSTFKYSNVGYDLLGELIRRVSGVPYSTYVQRRILEPLGMRATTLDPSTTRQARATGSDPREPGAPPGHWRPAIDHGASAGQASGGWWSTVEDLATWMRAQRVGANARNPVRARSLEEMHAPACATDERGGAYGLGWRIARRGGRSIVGHGGSTYGFEAIVGFDRDAGTAAIALVNGIPSTGSMPVLRDRLLDLASDQAAAAATTTTPPAAARMTTALPASAAAGGATTPAAGARLIGTFREVGFRNDVTLAAGPLLVDGSGTARELVATGDPLRFLVRDGRAAGETLRLLEDASGEVTAIELGGYYFERIQAPVERPPTAQPSTREEAP